MSRAENLLICEIFGPTIQGEGALIGRPTVFVRTAGCDYRCSWCDTLYAVESRYHDTWRQMTVEEIMTEIDRLTGNRPLLVTLSGGNPAMQPLGGLIALGRDIGYSFSLETQGSLAQSWFSQLEQLTISPKPPSSTMTTDWRKVQECLDAAAGVETVLKCVIMDEADYLFAREAAKRFPHLPVFLQPCNREPVQAGDSEGIVNEKNNARLIRLIDRVIADGWFKVRILPQLHVMLWGNKRGH